MHAPCSAEAGCPLPRLKETKTPSYRNTNSLARSEISPNCSLQQLLHPLPNGYQASLFRCFCCTAAMQLPCSSLSSSLRSCLDYILSLKANLKRKRRRRSNIEEPLKRRHKETLDSWHSLSNRRRGRSLSPEPRREYRTHSWLMDTSDARFSLPKIATSDLL